MFNKQSLGFLISISASWWGGLSFNFSNSEKELLKEPEKSTKLILSATEGSRVGLSLDVEKIFQQNKSQNKTEWTFKDLGNLGLQFHGKSFKEKDWLVSPCQNGKYYFAETSGSGFKLENGKYVPTLICSEGRAGQENVYENLKFVKLDKWTQVRSYGGSTTLSKIAIGSCKFKLVNSGREPDTNRKLEITCNQFLNYHGVGQNLQIKGTFDLSNYK